MRSLFSSRGTLDSALSDPVVPVSGATFIKGVAFLAGAIFVVKWALKR